MHRKSIGGALTPAAIAALTRPPQQAAAALAADVGALHAKGMSAREIATQLRISVETTIAILARIAIHSERAP